MRTGGSRPSRGWGKWWHEGLIHHQKRKQPRRLTVARVLRGRWNGKNKKKEDGYRSVVLLRTEKGKERWCANAVYVGAWFAAGADTEMSQITFAPPVLQSEVDRSHLFTSTSSLVGFLSTTREGWTVCHRNLQRDIRMLETDFLIKSCVQGF